MVIKFLNKKGQEFEIDCGEDEILLQAGLRNGVALPYAVSYTHLTLPTIYSV